MTNRPLSVFSVAIVALSLLPSPSSQADEALGGPAQKAAGENAGQVQVLVEQSRLSIRASAARIDQIVSALGTELGFESIFVGNHAKDPRIDLHIEVATTEAALKRILDGTNSMIMYRNLSAAEQETTGSAFAKNEDRVIDKVWLLESGTDYANGQQPSRIGAHSIADASLDPALDSNDVRTRSKAFMRLANRVDRESDDEFEFEHVLARLSAALGDDPEALVRTRAASTLGQLKDPRAVPALINALQDSHSSVRSQAIHALGEIGDATAIAALGRLLGATESTQAAERSSAVLALWKQQDPAAGHYLRQALTDPSPDVRLAAKRKPKAIPARGSTAARGTREIE